MLFRVAVAGLLLIGLSGAPAWSAPACDPGPSQADIDACTPEVHTHCGEFIPNREAITQCLRRKVNIIAVACRTVMNRPPSHLPPCKREQVTGN